MIDKVTDMEVDNSCPENYNRPRRTRLETQRILYGTNPNEKLELEGIVKVLKGYSDYEGGINCSICGKLYKSKVCFTKHLWEHSVYWDQFADEKNHDRVLSIQAALIMYSRFQGNSDTQDFLNSLLVTSPHDKKKDANNNSNNENHNGDVANRTLGSPSKSDVAATTRHIYRTPEKRRPLPGKLRSPYRKSSSSRDRKRSCSSSSTVSMTSLPGSVSPTFSLSDSDMSPLKSARQM